MNEQITIRVYGVVGSGECVSLEDGEKVHRLISQAFDQNRYVKLSFQNVDYVISAFLHPAIGQLYGEYDESFIRSHLEVSDMAEEDKPTLQRVVQDAKAYFKDPERAEAARRSVLEEDDGEG